jgi:hypothetical protein
MKIFCIHWSKIRIKIKGYKQSEDKHIPLTKIDSF